MVKNSHIAIPISAEVAGDLHRTEKRIERLSQNPTYTIFSNKNKNNLPHSCQVGDSPVHIMAVPVVSKNNVLNRQAIVSIAPVNLAFKKLSRCIG